MHDSEAACHEEIGDEAAVALPPGGLRAHEARRPRRAERIIEGDLPLGRSHPCRIASEGGLGETREALLSRFAAQAAAEPDRVAVADLGRFESRTERGLAELGVSARRRKAAYVDECPNAGLPEAGDKLFDWAPPMPDGEDGSGVSTHVSRRPPG